MSSFPAVDGATVSTEMWAFFQVEHRNAVAMTCGGRLPPLPATLGTAHESLCQAPPDVLAAWFTPNGEDEHWPTHTLIEFGMLLYQFGPDALLADFGCEVT